MSRFAWDGRDSDGRIEPDGAYRIRARICHADRPNDQPPERDPARYGSRRASPSFGAVHPRDDLARRRRPRRFAERELPRERAGTRAAVRQRHLARARTLLAAERSACVVRHRAQEAVSPRSLSNLASAPRTSPATSRRSSPPATVTIRYLALSPDAWCVRRRASGSRVHVSTDARHFRWVLGRRHGVGHGRTLTLRAPGPRDATCMYVEERGHAARASWSSDESTPPLLVLGVRRSGTTLLRVMLDRNSQLAIPDESYFVTQLAHRHGRRPDVDAFAEDMPAARRRCATGASRRTSLELRPGMTTGEAIAAIYERYAELQGKPRWGDKTPMYMQHLPLLERPVPGCALRPPDPRRPRRRAVLPGRAGRDRDRAPGRSPAVDASTSRASGAPRSRRRSSSAAASGPERYLEVRYEELVADAGARAARHLLLRGAALREPGCSPTRGTSTSREAAPAAAPAAADARRARLAADLPAADVAAFEGVAGDLLLQRLGYELLEADGATDGAGRARLARYRALITAWNATSYAMQRSPLWRRRHPRACVSLRLAAFAGAATLLRRRSARRERASRPSSPARRSRPGSRSAPCSSGGPSR